MAQNKYRKLTKILSQTIYLNKGRGITIKEAYNLLNGRSIHKDLSNKEGQKYQAWLQLDFKQIDNNGNYKNKTVSSDKRIKKRRGKDPIDGIGNWQKYLAVPLITKA
jgi:hypothetical protein